MTAAIISRGAETPPITLVCQAYIKIRATHSSFLLTIVAIPYVYAGVDLMI